MEAGTSPTPRQTGFYVFGGGEGAANLEPPLNLQPPFPATWVDDFSAYFSSLSAPVGPPWDYQLHSTVNDDFGIPFDAPQPGGMYSSPAVHEMLELLKVKVVAGLGHDGNTTGGLVPWMAEIEPQPENENEIPGNAVEMCEWMQIFANSLAFAFSEWYVKARNFDTPTNDPWFGASYKWHLDTVGPPISPTVLVNSSTRTFERWWNGDSYCVLNGGGPVPYLLVQQQNSYPDYVINHPVDRTDAQGRQTVAWYCPNWHNMGAAAVPGLIWHPHSHYQIIYWLANGAGLHYPYGASPDNTTDNTYSPYAPSGTKTYHYPKSDLGAAHGNQILNEFRQHWNANYSTYGVSAVSHLGIQRAVGQTVADAFTQNGPGLPWSEAEFLTMIMNLYVEGCMGPWVWPTPTTISGMLGSGQLGPF